MQSNINVPEAPTALPDIEADEVRESLLFEDSVGEDEEEVGDASDEEVPSRKTGSRTRGVLKGVAGFTVFLFLMGVGVTWFFGMGFFSSPTRQPVNRNGQKDSASAPMTEDEKLKAALTMVASKEPDVSPDSVVNEPMNVEMDQSLDTTVELPGEAAPASTLQTVRTLPPTNLALQGAEGQSERSEKMSNPPSGNSSSETDKPQRVRTDANIEPLGRSLFFGVTKPGAETSDAQSPAPSLSSTTVPRSQRDVEIPFGTLIPVRLVGAIYTLRNSGGVVRLELSQPIEGNGYSYPSGTILIGNLRGGDSVRAFVTIVGLIDPDSWELVKITGDLMGSDGASGLPGKRKRMTGKWSRFFQGLKETAGSVLGSVGAFGSGGTVILSEPLRRGSERLSEDTGESLFGSGREDSFLEVVAGTSGYILITQLQESRSSNAVAQVGMEKE